MVTRETIKSIKINPSEVHSVLSKHILADGFEMVLDLKNSQGRRLVDAKTGKTYLDLFSFFASSALGMNHPKLLEEEFLEKLKLVAINKPTLSDIYPIEYAEFVETFFNLAVPSYFKYAFFIEGGAPAVENALKVAFDWKMQKNLERGFYKSVDDESKMVVIHFRQAFHGRLGYTLSLTNTDPIKHKYFPKFKWPRIHNPAIKFPLNEENLKKVQEEEQLALNQIKDAIKEYGHNIAALIIEPIQAEGGDNHFRKEFLVALREICDENEIMYIMDEVQTGIGLTGKMWAHEHFVKPDIIAFGKKSQVCGILVGERVDEVKDNVFHVSSRINSTFGGNLTDMVRFARILEVIHEENLIENARVVGDYLLERLVQLQSEFPDIITNARGRGLMCAFDLPDGEFRKKFLKKVYENGAVMIGCGERSIRFRPPLTITKEEIDEGIEIIRKSLYELKD
jgi:L-lysine 6-transaminase